MTNERRSSADKKGRAIGFLRIGVSILLLVVLLKLFNFENILSHIASISPFLWLSVLVAFLGGHAVAAAKWRLLIGVDTPYLKALQAHFAGLAANIALPGVAGGDLVRASLVMKGSGRKTALALGSFADRLIDTAVLVLIAAAGAIWLGVRAGVDPAGLIAAALLVIAGSVAAIILMRPIAGLLRAKAPAGKVGSIICDIAETIEGLADRRSALFLCIALSFAIQFSFAVLNAMIAQNIGAGTSIAEWIFAWPLAKLIAILPISFGGLGVREASIASLMTPMGHAAAPVIAASLIWQSILYAGGLAGVIAQSVGLRRLQKNEEAEHG